MSKRGYYFDKRAAEDNELFFSELLVHTKGEWAGQPFILSPWERKIVRQVFGWKRSSDGTRKYRTVYIEMPRKGGKSTFASGLGLLLTFFDGEPGARVYSAAGDRDQAELVYDDALEMVEMSPELRSRSEPMKRAIFVPDTFSRFQAISRESGTKFGINAHGIIIDELHVHKTRDLYDTLMTSMGARRQPLAVIITTAGWDRTSICWEVHEYAKKVRDKVIDDPEFLPVIYCAEPEDDWTDPKVWHKANPGLGEIVSEEYLRKECERAQNIPGRQNVFKRLHLNLWTDQAKCWIPLADWDACEVDISLEEGLARASCYGGVDLSSTRDLSSLGLTFPPSKEDEKWASLQRFYMPADNVQKRVKEDRVPYDQWIDEGYIIPTPGNIVDQDFIRKDIEKLGLQVTLKELAFDRWNSTYLMTQLMEDGLTCVPFGQGFASMSSPSKEFETLIISRMIEHDGNPVMRWQMGNVAMKEDPAGNIKPDKDKSSEKIDGVVASIMSLGRAMFHSEIVQPSVYEGRGVLTI